MNDENKIDLSIEMYEDLKETLVKAIKNARTGATGNAGLENAQLERIERLIEAAELSQEQVAQLLEQLHNQITSPGVQSQREQAITDPVSYTHLDVYKRQNTPCQKITIRF